MQQDAQFLVAESRHPEPGFTGCIHQCELLLDGFSPSLFDQLGVPRPPGLAGAVAKRQAEFLAGRVMAGRAMQTLGIEPQPVAVHASRKPLWPAGVCGSISHCSLSSQRMVAVCALAELRQYRALGVDVEAWMSPQQADEVGAMVADAREYTCFTAAGFSFAEAVTLAFSAKESLYKLLNPLTDQWLDFADAEIQAVSDGQLSLRLLEREGAYADYAGLFECRYQCWPDRVLCWMWLPATATEC